MALAERCTGGAGIGEATGRMGEMPRTMRAVVIHENGGPERLTFHDDWPVPAIGPGEVLVRVRFCALNYLDIFVREGMPGEPVGLPFISGSDIAGDVVAVGDGVTAPAAGAAVVLNPSWGCGACEYCLDGEPMVCIDGHMLGEGDQGGLAEYVTIPAANCIPIPAGVTYEQAAALPVAWGTAWRMMVHRAKVRPGDDVLVLAAAGGVGLACVQIARLCGARVFAAASSDQKLARVKALGADAVINYQADPDWDRTVRAMTGKRGVDVVADTVGATTWERSIRALGKRGRLVTCGATAGPIGPTDIRYLFRREHNLLGSNGWTTRDIREVLNRVADGRLVPVIHGVYPLEETRAAEEALEGRQVFGKVLIQP